MKHAYLIIAHNEYEVLNALLRMLDDANNDVFLHVDKKIKNMPQVAMGLSRLFILEDRVDVRWGHVSQIEVMLALFKKANETERYAYLHLISGVHIPIKSVEEIRLFFKEREGRSVFNKMETSVGEINLKLERYNLFVKRFVDPNGFVQRVSQFCWKLGQKLQKVLMVKKGGFESVLKTSQWMSLTPEASSYLVERTPFFLKKYRYTFCGDEFFVATELNNSPFKELVTYEDRLLKCEFKGAGPKVYTMSDWEDIMDSDCLFARKFSNEHIDVVQKIEKILS